jgi:rare lipoprotein A
MPALFAYLLFPMATVFGLQGPHKGQHKAAAVKVQYGVASYYANKFEGRKTYTDEIFSQKKLTAASNTLPMHTWVRVTNLRNKRSVIVKINDKMHPHNKRLIDLSQAAAIRLGYKGRGLTHVRIDILGKKRPPDAEPEVVTKEE